MRHFFGFLDFRTRFLNRKGSSRAELPQKRFQPAIEVLESRLNPSLANLSTIAQSLRQAEDALPQIPGLDASLGQMAPSRLSDLLGLNAYGNGANTWSQFDATFPSPTAEDLYTIAGSITANSPYTATISPTIGPAALSGNMLTSSTMSPAYGSLPDLGLGQYSGFTVQAWFNSSNISSSWQRIIDLGNGTRSDNILVGVTGSKLFMSTYNGGSGYNFVAGPALASNTWYHVSAVFSGTTAKLFLNGAQVGTYGSMPQYRNVARANNYWGTSNWAGDPSWQGQQDELRFWNRALTSSEIAANYKFSFSTPQSGLIAYYKGDESTGQSVSLTNKSFETPSLAYGAYKSDPKEGGWTFVSNAGIAGNGSPFYQPDAPEGTQAAFIQDTQSVSQTFNVSVEGYYLVQGMAVGRRPDAINSILVQIDDSTINTIQSSSLSVGAWIHWSSPVVYLPAGKHTLTFKGVGDNFRGYGTVDSAIDNISIVSTSLVDSSGQGKTGFTNTDTARATSTLSLVAENGVRIQWSESGTYNSVFSTGDLDAGLHLNPSGDATMPITVSAGLDLTLALVNGSLQTGLTSTWTASANLTNLEMAIGLGYLRSSIFGGSYSLSASASATLFDSATGQSAPGGNNNPGNLLANTDNFTTPSSSQFQTSGNITVSANMPFIGDVAGNPFSVQPTVKLASFTANWNSAANPAGFTQPQWSVLNAGNYLALAQLDAASLVNTGLANAGGSFGSLSQTSWQTVPFSSSNVAQGYDWGAGLAGSAGLLYENPLSISGNFRIQGRIPSNNYGATFTIYRGTASATYTLSGNLNSDSPSLVTASPLVAGPIAYHFNRKLQGTGLGCREQPGHPGYLEFYAIDSTITSFTMDPANSGVNNNQSANGFTQLGFFAEPNYSLALQNGSFEGPNVGTWANNPQGGQWSFNADPSANNGITTNGYWIALAPADGIQAAFLTQSSTSAPAPTVTQALQQMDAGNYQLSFYAAKDPSFIGCDTTVTVDGTPLQFVINGTTYNYLPGTALNSSKYLQFTSKAMYLAAGSHTLQFSARIPSGSTAQARIGIDQVQIFTQTLTSEQATYPKFTSIQGLLDTINEPNLVGPGNAPLQLPNNDIISGQVYINQGITYTAATLPTALQFNANVINSTITPLLFSVSGGTYTVAAGAKRINVSRVGLQTAPLVFPTFTPNTTTTYVLGFTDRTWEVIDGTVVSNYSNPGTIGADMSTGSGTWAYSTGLGTGNGSLTIGTKFGATGTSLNLGRTYAFTAYQGLAQAGQGSLPRPDTDSSTSNSYVFTGAAYNSAFVPTSIRFYANAPGTITPMLFTPSPTKSSALNYQVAAIGNSVNVINLGANEVPILFPTLGNLTPGTTYLFGFKNSATGVIATQSGNYSSWSSTKTNLTSVGNSASFYGSTIQSLDIIASQAAGSPVISRSSLDTATGQVVLNPAQSYQLANGQAITRQNLPDALQVYATAPTSGTGWITPLLFQVGGTASAPTYTLAAAGGSHQIITSGSQMLPVEFAQDTLAALNQSGNYVMGFSTRQVSLGNAGAITTLSTNAGVIQYTAGGTWLPSGTISSAGLAIGSQFSVGSIGSATALAQSGGTYSATFLTRATSNQAYSALASAQYFPSTNPLEVFIGYTDINTGRAMVNITASAINSANVPHVTNLSLSGSEDVQTTVNAVRQFSLKLDASVFTNGASTSNRQAQATAYAETTGVVSAVSVKPGSQPFNQDGFISTIIPFSASSKVYSAPPAVSITDSAGKAFFSSATAPAFASLPDLGLGQYAGFTVQAWFNSTNIDGGLQRIIDMGNGPESDNIIVGVNGSRVFVSTYNQSTGHMLAAGPTLASKTWYQVSAVFDGSTATLYLNGQQVGTFDSMPLVKDLARSGNYWAADWSGKPAWQGKQDELRFWNRALAPSEIQGNWNQIFTTPQNGLIAYYKADQVAGNSVVDSSGLGKTGTFIQTMANPLGNPGFETPSQASTPGGYTYRPTGGTWTFAGDAGIARNGSPWYLVNAPEGTQAAFIQKTGTISQTVSITTPGYYHVSGQAIGRKGYTANTFNISIDGTKVGQVTASSLTSSAWSRWSTGTLFLDKGSHTLQLAGVGNNGQDVDTAVDSVALNLVPISNSSAPLPLTGHGALAEAYLDPNTGRIAGITLTSPGSGYASPIITIQDNEPAKAVATINFAGALTGATVSSGGQYYASAPKVIIHDKSGTGSGAQAIATISGGIVTAITITNGGSGYRNPMVVIDPPTVATASREQIIAAPVVTITDPTGVGAHGNVTLDQDGYLTGVVMTANQASGEAALSNGAISSIAVANPGIGYTTAPAVTITDSTGSGATATAIIANGVVTAITVTNAGSGYSNPLITIGPPPVMNSGYTNPTITFTNNSPATATASVSGGGVSAVGMVSGGSFYGTTPPVVTLSGGGGSGATATATVNNGIVTAITVNSPGTGYTSAPTITIAPPITATAEVTFGILAAALSYSGTLYTKTPNVIFSDSAGQGSGAAGYAVMVGGQVSDIVMTSYGSGYVSPVVTIEPGTIDITQPPSGPSTLEHSFYFLDGTSWTTTTSANSGISLQYQLIDHMNQLNNRAVAGLTGGSANSAPGYYNLAAYVSPLLSLNDPTHAETAGLGVVMPDSGNAPILWHVSTTDTDPFISQALFANNLWSAASLGQVTLGDINLGMNLFGTNGSSGFTGTAQVGYVDVNLKAQSFTPNVGFSLATTPGNYQDFATWQSNLGSDDLLAMNAATTATINSYGLTLDALASNQVGDLLGLPVSTNTEQAIPNVTFSVNSAGQGVFTEANWGDAKGLLYIDKSGIGTSFGQVSRAIENTDTSRYLGSVMPFTCGTLQDLTGFSGYFSQFLEDNLIGSVPADLDALIDWVRDNNSSFRLAYESVTIGSTSGFGLTLHPENWAESLEATTQVVFDVGTFASLAGGFNDSHLDPTASALTNLVVPPGNTGEATVSLKAAWQAPFGVFLANSDSADLTIFVAAGYVQGSPSTTAWNLTNIEVTGPDLDFQGTLGTSAIYFDASVKTPASVTVSGGAIAATLAANTLATGLVASTLGGTAPTAGKYNATLPVYYPTSTCYSGAFSLGGTNGSSNASLQQFLGLQAVAIANLDGSGGISGATLISGGANYASVPQVTIMDEGGNGSGATATATIIGGAVTAITITRAGSGYVSPVIRFSGGTRNSTNPSGDPSATFGLPSIRNSDIAALSLANALADPNVFQQGIGALQSALQSVFTRSMKSTSQIIIGTGTAEFGRAFDTYGDIAENLAATLTPFVPVCNQNATASATVGTVNGVSGALSSITLLSSGNSYTSTPLVTITDSNGGNGTGATATVTMTSDGNGGQKVASITLGNNGSGYTNPVVSIGAATTGNQSADAQLYNAACTVYNAVLATPGLVLNPALILATGTFISSQTNQSTTGFIPGFLDANGNPLTFSQSAQTFVNALNQVTNAVGVTCPLVIDYTLSATKVPFSFGMPGIPLSINNPADLNLVESGTATVDLSFGIDTYNGFFIIPSSGGGDQFSGVVNAGPDSNFSTTVTIGLLSGSMSASTGEIFSMPFTSVLTDPNGNGQITLAEINNMTPSALFQTTLTTPTIGMDLDFELKVAGGGIAAAIPGIGNTMSISWTPGQGSPQVSYNNFYLDLGSFISDYLGAVVPYLAPITNGVQPILSALGAQTPVLSDIIGGDTSILGLAKRMGLANTGFITAVSGVADMLNDITSAVNYIKQHPGESYRVPLGVVSTFAADFRDAASGLTKAKQTTKLPSRQDSINAVNSYLERYANSASNNFTASASKIVNQRYGKSGGLGISFDILDPQNIIGLITGQTVDIFHINFPRFSADFSIAQSYPLFGPLFMTFGGSVHAAVDLSIGFDSAGLEQWVAATVDGGNGLSPAALAGLAQDILMQGLFVDGDGTSITAGGSLSMGVQLNAGMAKAGVNGRFNIGMSMTPNADSSGRLNLEQMIQLAGPNFSKPLNLFDFDLTGSISADASLKVWLPFKWKKVWDHDFGSFTLFNVHHNPAPPKGSAASHGSLYLNMGATAGRRNQSGNMVNEHFEIRHLGGVAGDETLSVQLYDEAGEPQYVDEDGTPRPQVYYHVDKVVGIAGEGDDIIDCAGVLSPTHLEGGVGKDSLIGGQGVNYIDGGKGFDRIVGGPLGDILIGGEGQDDITGGGGADTIDAGRGKDTIKAGPGVKLVFAERFGGDDISGVDLTGSTLDFSAINAGVDVVLGEKNDIRAGLLNRISWTGKGPSIILLGKGDDRVTFTKGYDSVSIDQGGGRDRFQILAFNPKEKVTLGSSVSGQQDQILVNGTLGNVITADSNGISSMGAEFKIDWNGIRRLTIHQTASAVNVDFTDQAPKKLVIFGSVINQLGKLFSRDVRLEAKSLLSVQGTIDAAAGGSIALVTGEEGRVLLGTLNAARLSATNGNIHIESPLAYLGGKSAKLETLLANGHFSNESGRTIRAVLEPEPIFTSQADHIVVGQSGRLQAWSPQGESLSSPIIPFTGYKGVPRFDTASDLNGDGVADLVSVPGPGAAPHLVVYSGKDMRVLVSQYVFDPRFVGGLNVTTGDVNADGVPDIILAADKGATPHVVVLAGQTFQVLASFYAFDPGFNGGLRVGTADVDGNGVLDILTTTASGAISHVVAFSSLGREVLDSFYAFNQPVRNGVYIASADLDNDSMDEILLGTTGGTDKQVGVYRRHPRSVDHFMAYTGWDGEVRVGSMKVGKRFLIATGPGPGAGPEIRTFGPVRYELIDRFFAGNPGDLSGVTL